MYTGRSIIPSANISRDVTRKILTDTSTPITVKLFLNNFPPMWEDFICNI